jgi:hypothetical protein
MLQHAKFSTSQISQIGLGPKIQHISDKGSNRHLKTLLKVHEASCRLIWPGLSKLGTHMPVHIALLNVVTLSCPPTEVSPLYSQPNMFPHGSFQVI